MITVHHLELSRSHRVLWLLEELGLDYQIELYKRNPKTSLAPPELAKIHPLGKSPVITDGALTLAESGAILTYLLETYDPEHTLIPERGGEAWRRFTYWMHYAEGSLMPFLVMKLVFGRISKAPVPALVRPIGKAISKEVGKAFLNPNIKTHLSFIEAELSTRDYLTGDALSGADIQMSYPLEAALSHAGSLGAQLTHTRAYLKRLSERPAYQRASSRGGPHMMDA